MFNRALKYNKFAKSLRQMSWEVDKGMGEGYTSRSIQFSGAFIGKKIMGRPVPLRFVK